MMLQQLLNNVEVRIATVVNVDDRSMIRIDHFQLDLHSCCWETTFTKTIIKYTDTHVKTCFHKPKEKFSLQIKINFVKSVFVYNKHNCSKIWDSASQLPYS